MFLVQKAQQPRRPGRPTLALALVLALGVSAGAAATAFQRPEESRAAMLGFVIPATRADADTGTSATPSATPLVERGILKGPDRVAVPDEDSGLLAGAKVPRRPTGKLVTVQGRERAPGDGEVMKVRVVVEKGLPVDSKVFADAVMATLNDPRGWSSVDGVTFARTDRDDHDFRVVLAGPDTTDELCHPLDTGGSLSCGVIGSAVLNFRRWVHGSDAWESDARYRQYLVNHEVGHVLGHPHDQCAGKGKRATVMVQQTLSTQGCRPQPWPAPDKG